MAAKTPPKTPAKKKKSASKSPPKKLETSRYSFADADNTVETRMPFDSDNVEDALAEPLEDVTGIQRLTGDLAQQWGREKTNTKIFPRRK